MSVSSSSGEDFQAKITNIIEDNLADEQFGVSELARDAGMSRSNLLRKVKKLTNLSVSQFIRQVRLRHGMEMLKETSLSVSEVSFRVGFNSTSYFIKCFHDFYGYPPGEVGKNDIHKEDQDLRSQSHQLVAIMFTDIAGYTALMQQDEDRAVAFRKKHREVFNEVTLKFNGKILQYYGDGTLSTFNSAIDAVKCGIELQQAFNSSPKIPVRIGIHIGDTIFTEDDIIGDGVNVASRIESLAIPGSIMISEKVHDEVRNQQDIQTISMGHFELKNVAKPMEVFAVSNPGIVIPKKNQITGGKGRKTKGNKSGSKRNSNSRAGIKWALVVLAAVIIGYFISVTDIFDLDTYTGSASEKNVKSIAVLPFINDSGDSSNVYIINGLMEAILNNLQQIEDLKVISRTSIEKYRQHNKTIPEISEELNVKYLIEGSGQKIGEQILLNIQLIDGFNDEHLWAAQYNREVKDIFKLQREVAKSIAGEIQAVITPEEDQRIEKTPTNNLLAYDYFLQGLDLLYMGSRDKLLEAIPYFDRAIEEDSEFALAYADLAITYYILDRDQAEKKYLKQINDNADKALLYDQQLPQSLIAKAFSFMHKREYQQAVPFLEKALEYNPNSAIVINTLADFYVRYSPDTKKYLEYALQGIMLDIAGQDSATASFNFLHVSNAFIQSGFTDLAEFYINKSLDYYPENLYAEYVKAYILYAKNKDLEKLNSLLIAAFNKDTTRLDIVQEVAKSYYYQRDYESSYAYYKPFMEVKEAYGLNIYPAENGKIGVVFSEMGEKDGSEIIFADFKVYAENDQSIYKHFNLCVYYSFHGDTEKAIKHLKLFSKEDHYHYWTILFAQIDPLMDNIKEDPVFKEIINEIETKFWNYHDQIRASLEEKGLI